MRTLRVDATSGVIHDDSAQGLRGIHMAGNGLAIWQRLESSMPQRALHPLRRNTGFSLTVEGNPAEAAHDLAAALPSMPPSPIAYRTARRRLIADIRSLAALFAAIAGLTSIRLRFDHVTDDACWKFHTDAVGLRLLCTYAGPGTEWLDAAGHVRRLTAMQVAIFKGEAYRDQTHRILHRSPPLGQRPPRQRSRLLLCIDDPDHFC